MKPARRSVFGAWNLLLAILLPLPLDAQQPGVILGVVVDALDGSPLSRAQVAVPGTKLQAITKDDGTFRLEGVTAGDVTVTFEMQGYGRMTEVIAVDAGWATELNVEMTPVAVLLGALRIGTGSDPENEKGAYKRTEVKPSRPGANSTVDVLAGQVPGVQVRRMNGSVGSGASILIRGPASLVLSNDPVVYVDGVRVFTSMPTQQGRRGGGAMNLDFIDIDTIERIEVVRGPSAGAQYGPDASTGAILIFTKRGARR